MQLVPPDNSIAVLFCKTDLPLSTVIMWGTDQPASHVGIVAKNWVVHSDLTGLHKVYRDAFNREHTVVDQFHLICTPEQQAVIEQKFLSYVDADSGSSYDYGAIAYFSMRAALAKGFGIPMPKTNPFGDDQQFLCTEATYLLNEAIVETTGRSLYPYDTDLGATTAWDLRNLLIKFAGGSNELILRPNTATTYKLLNA